MTKVMEKEVVSTIKRRRGDLLAIREEIEDLMDYLDVLEARTRSNGKRRLSHDEVKKRFGIK